VVCTHEQRSFIHNTMLNFLFPKKSQKVDLEVYPYFENIEVDIHSHLIPGIDDGSPNISTSIELLRSMAELGFKKIITTPHISELYPNNGDTILDGLIRLKKQMKHELLNIDLTVAAEYMINDLFEQNLMKEVPLLTLADKYILVEMSHLSEPINLYRVLSILKSRGFIPVLAHPERYRFYNNNLYHFEKLKTYGCLFQMNVLSLIGYYGSSICDCAKLLIENNLIDFIGSDLHHQRHLEAIKKGMAQEYNLYLINNYPFKNKELFNSSSLSENLP
jgi:protein-tyrosine phosphatase